MRTTQCRSCGADTFWIQTRSGKKMMLNAEPLDMEAIDPEATVFGDRGIATKAKNAYSGFSYYSSHFSTCPDADTWRKKK